MIHADALLVKLVLLLDKLPQPKQPPTGGRPLVYPETLFLKALVIMTLRRLYKPGAFLAVLDEPTMQPLKTLLTDTRGRFPCRRTWERRLARLPASLPQRIGLIGRILVEVIQPWKTCGRAVALDSTVLQASGGVWHKKHREEGLVPHSRIDTEAAWTKSGYHGWVYGWKLHLAVTVAAVWIPLAARLTPANEADQRGRQPRGRVARTRIAVGDPVCAGRQALQRAQRRADLPVAESVSGDNAVWAVSAHGRRGEGPPRLSQAA